MIKNVFTLMAKGKALFLVLFILVIIDAKIKRNKRKMESFFESEYYQEEVNKYLSKYGEVPPPWVAFEDSHPYDMLWRMGAGEDFLDIYRHWCRENLHTLEEKIAYYKKNCPPPRWLEHVIDAVWGDILEEEEEEENVDYSPYFEKLKAYGFQDVDKFEEDSNNYFEKLKSYGFEDVDQFEEDFNDLNL